MRTYTDTERERFAAYIDARAAYRPAECHGGLDCWVEFGPPAMTNTRGTSNVACCVGCLGAPRFNILRPGQYARPNNGRSR